MRVKLAWERGGMEVGFSYNRADSLCNAKLNFFEVRFDLRKRLQVEKKDGRRVEGQLGRVYLLLTDDTGLKVYFSDRVVGGREREILLER
jgi:hypothetical protein